jgi:hypothetical protein
MNGEKPEGMLRLWIIYFCFMGTGIVWPAGGLALAVVSLVLLYRSPDNEMRLTGVILSLILVAVSWRKWEWQTLAGVAGLAVTVWIYVPIQRRTQEDNMLYALEYLHMTGVVVLKGSPDNAVLRERSGSSTLMRALDRPLERVGQDDTSAPSPS